MIPNVPRECTQFISLTFIIVGLFLLLASATPFLGVACIGFSCWVLMMSESVLHAKVQGEMSAALEVLRKKQEADIQDLLYFLKQSQLAAAPFETIEGAKKLLTKMSYPAMVLTTTHQIIKANQRMHKLLGWKDNDLNGMPVHVINDAVVLSRIGELCAKPEHIKKDAMITQYVYLHKSGKRIFGQMDAVKIVNIHDGFFSIMPA
jgi:PAS domain-containing protein